MLKGFLQLCYLKMNFWIAPWLVLSLSN